MSDWEDLCDDDNKDLLVEKQGEFNEEIKEVKKDDKPIVKKENVEKNTQENKVKELPKKVKKKDKKKNNNEKININNNEITNEEKLKIEQDIKNEANKDIVNLFGGDIGKSLIDVDLNDNQDFNNFAKIIYTKLNITNNKKLCVTFINKLLQEFKPDFDRNNYKDIQDKVNVLVNLKLKEEKTGKNKKKAKGPNINVQKKANLYEDYEDNDFDNNNNDYDDGVDDFM